MRGITCAHPHTHTHAHMPTLDRNEWQQTQEKCYQSIAKTGKDLLKLWVTVTSDCHYSEPRNK